MFSKSKDNKNKHRVKVQEGAYNFGVQEACFDEVDDEDAHDGPEREHKTATILNDSHGSNGCS
jgi:hypothetical protein